MKNGDDEQRHAAENKARALLPDGLEVIDQTAHGQREDHAADQRNDFLARREPSALAGIHKAVQPFVFQREGRVQNQVRAENQNDEQPHLHALRNGQKRRQIQGCEHQLIDQIENQNHLAHRAPAPYKTGGEQLRHARKGNKRRDDAGHSVGNAHLLQNGRQKSVDYQQSNHVLKKRFHNIRPTRAPRLVHRNHSC